MATTPKAKAAKTTETVAEAAETAADVMKKMTDAAFSYPKFEVPEAFRSIAETSLKQTREAYASVKSAAEEATDLLEESLESNRKSVREAQLKALEMAKANTDATFDLMRKMLAAGSVTDAFAMQTAFARERFEALMGYSKEMQEMMSKAGAEASKPAKAMFDKTVSFAKAA